MKFLLHSPFWTWTLSIAQATLEFSILQLQLHQELMIQIENMVPNWSSAYLLKEDAFPLSVYYEVHFCPYLCVIVGLLRTPYFLFLLIKPHIFIHINFCSLFFSFLNITPYVNLPLTSGLCSARDWSLIIECLFHFLSYTEKLLDPKTASQSFFVFHSDWHKSRFVSRWLMFISVTNNTWFSWFSLLECVKTTSVHC